MFVIAIDAKVFKFLQFLSLLCLGFPKNSLLRQSLHVRTPLAVIHCFYTGMVGFCGGRGVSCNVIIKSQSFSRSVSLHCDRHSCFLASFSSLGERGSLEGARVREMPSPRLDKTLVKSSPWRVGLCYGECLGVFHSPLSSLLLPETLGDLFWLFTERTQWSSRR